MIKYLNLMQQICKENKIKLILLKKDEGYGGFNYALSAVDEIMLAPFIGKNANEKRLISFFHEFSHLKLENQIPKISNWHNLNIASKLEYEIWVSLVGINYAKEHYGILFLDETIKWLIKQNFSYVNLI